MLSRRRTLSCLVATAGLAYYRLGNPVEGRKHYDLAIEAATRQNIQVLRATARLYLARERCFSRQIQMDLKNFRKAYGMKPEKFVRSRAYRLLRSVSLNKLLIQKLKILESNSKKLPQHKIHPTNIAHSVVRRLATLAAPSLKSNIQLRFAASGVEFSCRF